MENSKKKQQPELKPKSISENYPNAKNPAAVALGRLGGLVGGKMRAAKLTAERRKEIAQIAAKKRWNVE